MDGQKFIVDRVFFLTGLIIDLAEGTSCKTVQRLKTWVHITLQLVATATSLGHVTVTILPKCFGIARIIKDKANKWSCPCCDMLREMLLRH